MADIRKALKLNPILRKELRLGSRSIKIPIFVMIYDIVLAILAVTSMLVISMTNRSSGSVDFSNYLYIYQIIGWTQLAITLIIVPILTAGTISGERERQTLDIMLTTPKKPITIVWGKLLAALSNYMIFVISSIPIMAIAFVLGGLNWFALLGYIVMMIVVAIYVGSIGVFCSSTFKRTIASIVMTFLISFALLVIPYILFFMIYGIGEMVYESMYYTSSSTYTNIPDLNMGILPMIMLVNPLSGFLDYMLQTMDISSMHELIEEMDAFGTIMPILAYGWIPMNVIVSGAISYFFIFMASKKLNPIKRIKKRNRKNASPIVGATGMQTQINPVQAQPMPMLYQPGQSSQPKPAAEPAAEPSTEPLVKPSTESSVEPQAEEAAAGTATNPITEKLIGGTNVR